MIFTTYSMVFFIIILAIIFIVGKSNHDLAEAFSVDNTSSWRFLLAILIIVHHFACSYYYIDVYPWLVSTPFYQLGCVLVAAFFMISGYGLTKKAITQGFVGARQGFLKKRFRKLLPIFIGLFIAALLFRKVFLGESIIDELHKYPKYSQVLWYSWFMLAIIYCYVAVNISLYLKSKLQFLLSLLVLSGVYFYFVKHVFGLWFFWWDSIFAFNIGTFIAAYSNIINRILKEYYRVSIVLLTVAICLSHILLVKIGGGGRIGLILSTINNYSVYIIVIFLFMLVDLSNKRYLKIAGGISYEIYLLHGFFICSSELLGLNLYVGLGLTVVLSVSCALLLKQRCLGDLIHVFSSNSRSHDASL